MQQWAVAVGICAVLIAVGQVVGVILSELLFVVVEAILG